jgi:protein SCO1
MKTLQQRFEEAKVPVKLVSFSVDPESDTPEVLNRYAEKNGITSADWNFLTGPTQNVATMLKGFHFSLEPKVLQGNAFYEIAHTQKLVMVDPQGAVRGYYSSDSTGIDEVFHRAQHVLRSFGK